MSLQDSSLEHKNMDEDELEETLSLCDLPLYGDQSVEGLDEDLSLESQGSTSISMSSSDDYFEFFSHEFNPSASCFPPENIIFCGKILPYKKPVAPVTIPSKEAKSKQPTSIKKKRGWSMFRWRFGSRGSKTGNKSTILMQKKDHQQTTMKKYNSNKQGKGYDFPLHKMSILTSSSSGKARWYLFLTGISRISSRIELRSIKSRQSRRKNHSPPPTPTLRVQNHDDKVAGGTRGESSSLWKVIRVLSCGGNQSPNATIVGPISCNLLE